MKRLLRLLSLPQLILAFLIALVFQNCTQENIKEITDETPNITEYLRENPEYSMFLEILDITNYASFMNTYGTYTLFLPTNDAVKQYLKDVGAASLKDVPLADLQNIAKLHILDQKIKTNLFTDGKIATPSMYGQYLVTGAANINNVTKITVNKTSRIVAPNLEVGNGVIHVIDKVLRVADKTIAQTIEADPNLSLFTEVLKATGWYDKLNQPLTYDANKVGSYTSVLAQTNDVFSKAGFNNLDDLKKRYSKEGDPTKATDSLNLFVQYRVLPQLIYLADLAATPVFVTKAPLEVIASKLEKDVIYLNRDVYNGVFEKGVAIVREYSDVTATNGVLHFVNGNFFIKKRPPMPVYFDVCDQSEFAANVSNYRKSAGISFGLGNGALSEVTWVGAGTLSWNNYSGGVNGDLLSIFRFRHSLNGNNDIEFKTPVIIKGRYKIWVSYCTGLKASPSTKVFFDGEQTSRVINQKEYASDPTAITDRVYESQGYKRYIFPYVKSDYLVSRLVGVVDVTTTGRHLIKFTTDVPNGGSGPDADRLDLIEFRPVDMDQIWPKFKKGVPEPGISNLVQREDATRGDNGNSGY